MKLFIQNNMTEDSNLTNNSVSFDSSTKTVKSNTIVKYSTVSTPANFAQLQCNTDLNLPPSNWLSTSAESYGFQNVWSRSTGFSSFRMANMFPDCVGEVDVISDAENIKKLLKLPYSSNLVSMIVHRVENTLLLDDFDIHKYLLRQAENDWEWLKKFFYEHVFESLGDKEKRLFPKANRRNVIQQKNLISKFLYHSLVPANDKERINERPTIPVKQLQPLLPEPSREEKLPDPNYNHNFARNVIWTFENIQMLVGTDMPIFGGQTHPCISLRLRHATKPINVLTGIDYWLDNLMCNVPEVVMCYHLDGIVQKYELIKTEDLPNLDDAKFSPKVIRDIAQNILSFLKNNATKAGHTYWLFKGKDDDVVKLYDLSSLCSDMSDDKSQNPFTVPVAMLLYRVARNMKYSVDYKRNRGTIRMLLKNCIQLLTKEKYPQIVTSAHFMLADLYISDDIDPTNPNFSKQNDEDELQSNYDSNPDNEKSDEKFEQDMNAAIKCLTLPKSKEHQFKDQDFEEFKFKPPPITGLIEERCQYALEHVYNGLVCLKYFPAEAENIKCHSEENYNGENYQQDVMDKDPTIRMAKPFQAIPMPYAQLYSNSMETETKNKESFKNFNSEISFSYKKKSKQKKKKIISKSVSKNNGISIVTEDTNSKALLYKTESQTLPTWQVPKKDNNRSWSAHLKILLYEKASLVFVVLAENEYLNKNYGASLRYIFAVLRCQKFLEVLCRVRNDKLICYILGRAGDCCFMIVQDWINIEKHRNDFETKNSVENSITDTFFIMENLKIYGAEIFPKHFDSLETTLVASYKFYNKALTLEPLEMDRNNLLRRLGNIHNELGVLYMNQAGSRYQLHENVKKENISSDVTSPLLYSLKHLEAGIKAFEIIHDEANLALLYSNTGRLMRLSAHVNTKHQLRERHFYNKALSNYQRALQILGTRKINPSIWDNVTWDLSSTLFTMATLLQDYLAANTTDDGELEREIIDIFHKALKYCDIETYGPRQPVYQFRAATIQHRLASLYHQAYRKLDHEIDSAKRKSSLQVAKLYYEKAANLLLLLEQTTEFLTVQMERVALKEFQAHITNTYNGKFKVYQSCLELILQSKAIIEIIVERNKSIVNNIENESIQIKEDNRIEENCQKNEDKNLNRKGCIKDEEHLVILLEQRLQFILKSLIKLCIIKNAGNKKKEYENYATLYKKCYSLTLHSDTLSGIILMKHINNILVEIKNVLQQ